MKIEFIILLITAFFIVNTYYDGKYTKMLLSWKKYYKMIFIGILGFGLYLIMKKNPKQGKNILLHANNMVKYMPIDRGTVSMLNPILDFTSMKKGFMENYENNVENNTVAWMGGEKEKEEEQGIGIGKKPTKRSVSETKKKYVASQQNWKCGNCQQQLNHTFEIDHKMRLEYGGTNDVSNLVALCRNCHGNKTAMENM
jgi:hypothetical protein